MVDNYALKMTAGGGTVVRVYFWQADPERMRRAFDVLESHRDAIEASFGEKLRFQCWTNGAPIEKRHYGDPALNERNRPELHKEMINWYRRLRPAVDLHLPDALAAATRGSRPWLTNHLAS